MSPSQRGFTLLEVLVVIAVLVVLVAIVGASFRNYNRRQAAESAAGEVVALLSDARGKTLAGTDDTSHGVHLEAGSVTLFAGGAYDPNDPSNIPFLLSEDVSITAIILTGGGDDVVFERLTGETDAHGTITVASAHDEDIAFVVTVEPTGLIYYE